MEEQTRKLYEAALQLPDSERETLIELLMPSIDWDDPNDVEASWIAEAERRAEELGSGAVTAIPWSEAKERLRQLTRAKA